MTFARGLSKLVLASMAVVILMASAYLSALYWWTLFAGDQKAQYVFVAISVAATTFKIGLPVLIASTGESWRHNKPVAFAWCVALCFDLLSSYGYSQQSAGTVSADAARVRGERAELRGGIKARETKLSAVPQGTRAVPVIEALQLEAERRAGRCVTKWENDQEHCREVFKLRNELAQARTRDQIEGEILLHKERLARLPLEVDANPQRTVIRDAMNGLGVPVGDEGAGRVLSVLLLLLLEICPLVALDRTLRPQPPAPERLAKPGRMVRATAKPASAPRKAGAQDVLAVLQGAAADAHGWIGPFTQRQLGERLGLSPTEVNRQIRELVEAGTIEKRAGRGGTSLKFATPAQNVQPLRRIA